MFKYLLSLYLSYCMSFKCLRAMHQIKYSSEAWGKNQAFFPHIFFTACSIKSFWLCMTTEQLVRKIIKSLNSSLKETFQHYASKDHNVLDTSKHESEIPVTWMKAKTGPFTLQIDYLLYWIGLIMNAQYAYSIVLTFMS